MNTERRKCTNCAHCDRFRYSPNDKRGEMYRCWYEPGVCDHAFVRSVAEGENYVCDEHRFKDEWENEMFEKTRDEYIRYLRGIKRLQERYPQLKDIKLENE